MTEEKLQPIHPGEILLEEFLKPMELSQNQLALSVGVPARRINEIVLRQATIRKLHQRQLEIPMVNCR